MKRQFLRTTKHGLLLLSLLLISAVEAGQAPDFTAKGLVGDNQRLAEHRGDIVLLNFWASWCGPCRQEMPKLEALQKHFSAAGFTVLAVSVDEDEASARALAKELDVSFPMLLDQGHAISAAYQLQAVPSTVVIDRDGQVQYVHQGYLPGDEKKYRKKIMELMKR